MSLQFFNRVQLYYSFDFIAVCFIFCLYFFGLLFFISLTDLKAEITKGQTEKLLLQERKKYLTTAATQKKTRTKRSDNESKR